MKSSVSDGVLTRAFLRNRQRQKGLVAVKSPPRGQEDVFGLHQLATFRYGSGRPFTKGSVGPGM